MGPKLWSKYILRSISALGTHFKYNFVLIANMQLVSNKIDSDSVYLALQTGENESSSGNLHNIFDKNQIY